jgi:hypothetical protein
MCSDVDWIEVVSERIYGMAVVNMVVTILVPYMVMNLTS